MGSELRVLPLLLMIVATLLGAAGQLFFKKGAVASTDILSLIFNMQTISGLILYGLATLIYLYALKMEELSRLSPIIALSYVWTVLLAITILGEKVPPIRWLGIILVIIGVALIAM